jgi:hypothetical protein
MGNVRAVRPGLAGRRNRKPAAVDLGLGSKRALVSGSTAGIGLATARWLALEGDPVTQPRAHAVSSGRAYRWAKRNGAVASWRFGPCATSPSISTKLRVHAQSCVAPNARSEGLSVADRPRAVIQSYALVRLSIGGLSFVNEMIR